MRSPLTSNIGHSKPRRTILSKAIRGWVNVREYPSERKSEESYIRNKDVQRVFMVENEDKTFSVLVHALGDTYLATTSEGHVEAIRQLESIVHEICEN
jgi:hypothetical protein